MIAATATQVAGWALALGTVAGICALAGLCTFAATKYAYDRARTWTTHRASLLVAVVVALLTFGGGWLLFALWWTAARSTRLARRLAA